MVKMLDLQGGQLLHSSASAVYGGGTHSVVPGEAKANPPPENRVHTGSVPRSGSGWRDGEDTRRSITIQT